ncbi:MAG: class I SAM-dependent methyltransferase [Planctomycetes bacterium]|nr:class I SAM-dependent methyltransferase [Planctomycetota bacterium]
MATDIDAIVSNLISFYDMRGKSIVYVGAGGGQMIRCAANARSVLGVDSDPIAISQLETAIRDLGLEDRFSVYHGEFSSVSEKADAVFFELCLHEMDDPAEALSHAQSLANEILVLDHLPESSWAWYTCEEEKAARSWEAVRRFSVLCEASFKATQHFETYSQLFSKIQVLGEKAIDRIGEFSEREGIRISMDYAVALLQKETA